MSDRSLAELEEFFLALSDGTRLRLLSLIRNGEVSVGYLSEKLDQSQPKISRHLAYLRSAGLVETRRDGKWIYYKIAKPASPFASTSLDEALDWVGSITGETSLRKRVATEDRFNLPESKTEINYSNEIEIYLL